eukprot:849524-Rhodomonas_salina.1
MRWLRSRGTVAAAGAAGAEAARGRRLEQERVAEAAAAWSVGFRLRQFQQESGGSGTQGFHVRWRRTKTGAST